MSEASWHRFGASGWLETGHELSFQDPLDVFESLPEISQFFWSAARRFVSLGIWNCSTVWDEVGKGDGSWPFSGVEKWTKPGPINVRPGLTLFKQGFAE